jgi:broad specificity phosphatase PhoE
MPKLFFIRHCESEANLKNILAGQIDYPLTEKGVKDAKEIAFKFTEEFNIDRIISSPLKRAIWTAAPFSEILKIKTKTDDRLIEQNAENTLPVYPEALPGNGEIWEVDFAGLGKSHIIISHFYSQQRLSSE